MKKRISGLKSIWIILLIATLLTTSVRLPAEPAEHAGLYVHPFSFDHTAWAIGAAWQKFSQTSLGLSHYLTRDQRDRILSDYLDTYAEGDLLRMEIEKIYTDPKVEDPHACTKDLRQQLAENEKRMNTIGVLTETVVQNLVSEIIVDVGLAKRTQPFPPVLYHAAPLPKSLVLSPRGEIQQVASYSLLPDLDLQQIMELEALVERETGLSALVVPVGGVETYPTMVLQTDQLPYLFETVAHEWTHNYLALRPLGMRYSASHELRTMNETTASIAGQEISRLLMDDFYPNPTNIPPSPYRMVPVTDRAQEDGGPALQPAFDFQQEMYNTRLQVDALLQQGKINEAEAYMENRRGLFWENGYQIRRLNQAYFAFYGAYAEQPLSAAGADPVGKSIRELWNRSPNLADFIRQMSVLATYDQLKILVESY